MSRMTDVLVHGFPAEVTTTTRGDRTAYRVAGEVRASVEAAVSRLAAALVAGRQTATFTRPVRWGDEWVVHGEVVDLTT